MNKKIMICGASGTGKTTLANHISELYKLPYVSTSAKEVWPRFGFENHADAHLKSTSDKKIGSEYQIAILSHRIETLKEHDRFVTDRSFVDNAAYIMMELGHLLTECETDMLFEECSKGMRRCDGLIHLSWNSQIALEDDNNRIVNHHFQEMTDTILTWVINMGKISTPCSILKLNMWDFETRIQLVDKWINRL